MDPFPTTYLSWNMQPDPYRNETPEYLRVRDEINALAAEMRAVHTNDKLHPSLRRRQIQILNEKFIPLYHEVWRLYGTLTYTNRACGVDISRGYPSAA